MDTWNVETDTPPPKGPDERALGSLMDAAAYARPGNDYALSVTLRQCRGWMLIASWPRADLSLAVASRNGKVNMKS